MRNRLQTRRDDLTVSWLELDTFFDINIDNPFDRTQFSNVFNKLYDHAGALGDAGDRFAVLVTLMPAPLMMKPMSKPLASASR